MPRTEPAAETRPYLIAYICLFSLSPFFEACRYNCGRLLTAQSTNQLHLAEIITTSISV